MSILLYKYQRFIVYICKGITNTSVYGRYNKFQNFLKLPVNRVAYPRHRFVFNRCFSIALPVTHLIIAVTLLVCIAVLSVGIVLYKKKHNIAGNTTTGTPVFDL
jgi:hypothetical protein